MKEKLRSVVILALTIVVLLLAPTRLPADTGMCGGCVMTTVPFTDVMGNIFFCSIAEAYFSGLTNGTTPTTYSPSAVVLRDQMSAFVTRTQDSTLRRASRQAALRQWATPPKLPVTSRTTVGPFPQLVASDGLDLWVASIASGGSVARVRASDGTVLGTWTGATNAFGVLIARGRIYITGETNPQGHLYVIDPGMAPGPVATLSSLLGGNPNGISTDGTWIWTANRFGSVSKIDPDTGVATNITTGFNGPGDILFDGANLWVTDFNDNKLKKLDATGNVIQNAPVGNNPQLPVFDGSNIWVPNAGDNSVTVVRVRDGMVLATLTGNGLSGPAQAAFDGERILVTNVSANSVSLWKATDLTPIGSVSTGMASPFGACSDGLNFWITLGPSQLARL